jgi:4-hydroxythreonine-4-phosphate dehydrogenase
VSFAASAVAADTETIVVNMSQEHAQRARIVTQTDRRSCANVKHVAQIARSGGVLPRAPLPAFVSAMNAAPIALTCGDPAGIGPEIVATWLAAHREEAATVAVLGSPSWLASLTDTRARLVPIGAEDFAASPGQPTEASARVAWEAMERAAAGTQAGEFSAVVTGPVSKSGLQRLGFPFPGQTEFFAARWGGEPTMAFAGGRLRVVLLTWHVPFRTVPDFFTPAHLARTVRAADALARSEGITAPRIGVCGLNPHAGEGGLLGNEERTMLDPLLEGLRADFPHLSSCQPGDTLFARALRGEFDVVIALYHDQGLAPLKTVEFDDAVNVTLGLPFVRTSPDHGTAFGLAGQGKASARSFTQAVAMSRRLLRARSG